MTQNLLTVLLAVVFLLGGCKTAETPSQYRSYSFEHDGSAYLIVNMGNPTLGNSNILIHREGDEILLKAKDFDRDGMLDTLVVGTISLDQANAIYESGIEKAATELKLESRLPTYTYLVSSNEAYYTIESYSPDQREVIVRFIVFLPENQETSVFQDDNADGFLDRKLKGQLETVDVQSTYRTTLEQGVSEGRIKRSAGRYMVVDSGTGPRV